MPISLVQTDPIADIEVDLSDALARELETALQWTPEGVETHFREDTVVFLIEGEGLPEPTAGSVVAAHSAIAEAIAGTLDREIEPAPFGRRVSERTLIVVTRLR